MEPNFAGLSKPLVYLELIKSLQAKGHLNHEAVNILKQSLDATDTNLRYLIHPIPKGYDEYDRFNILHYLDSDCNAETVEIILDTIKSPEEACRFIMSTTGGCPSPFEFVLRSDYKECALPMIKLLWANHKTLSLCQPRLIGLNIITFNIVAMIKKTIKKLYNASEKTVLLTVIEKLRKSLKKTPYVNSENWLTLEENDTNVTRSQSAEF